ncbi:MAG TPA: D-alanine--D-alanine ligase [Bacillota bacterium]|nr:D-alanine--D-alanine ligase [Bacillota bacterium]
MKKVAVLYGGLSEEREVSLRSGAAVGKALQEKGFQVTMLDVNRQVAKQLMDDTFDVAYIALHGHHGEDGTIQGLLEILGIPYTGPGVLASALAMNKIATKRMLLQFGLPTPGFTVLMRHDILKKGIPATVAELKKSLTLPLVVKAATQGSTIGIYFINKWEEMAPGLEQAFNYDSEVLVEEFIKGMELTASVLGNEEPVALPLIEITTVTGCYDYQTKYTVGMSSHIIPPQTP